MSALPFAVCLCLRPDGIIYDHKVCSPARDCSTHAERDILTAATGSPGRYTALILRQPKSEILLMAKDQ
jgi:hypothetical protein